MKVRIVQLLCPQRHCIMATPYESPDGAVIASYAEAIKREFGSRAQKQIYNPWCGLCRSRDLKTEDSPTKFTTMAEALPGLRQVELEQAITREYFRTSKG